MLERIKPSKANDPRFGLHSTRRVGGVSVPYYLRPWQPESGNDIHTVHFYFEYETPRGWKYTCSSSYGTVETALKRLRQSLKIRKAVRNAELVGDWCAGFI